MPHRAGEFAELGPWWAIAAGHALPQLVAHQRAHGLITDCGSALGTDGPGFRFAAVGDVAEPLIERPGAWIAFLYGELGPVQASVADPLLGGLR